MIAYAESEDGNRHTVFQGWSPEDLIQNLHVEGGGSVAVMWCKQDLTPLLLALKMEGGQEPRDAGSCMKPGVWALPWSFQKGTRLTHTLS